MNDDRQDSAVGSEADRSVARELPPAARRALEEAEARRAEAKSDPAARTQWPERP